MKHYFKLNFKKFGLRSVEAFENPPNPILKAITKEVDVKTNSFDVDKLHIPRYIEEFSSKYSIINFSPYDIDNMAFNIRKEFYPYEHKFINILDMMNVFVHDNIVFCSSAGGYDSVLYKLTIKELKNFETFFRIFFVFKFIMEADIIGEYRENHHMYYKHLSKSNYNEVQQCHKKIISSLKGRGVC